MDLTIIAGTASHGLLVGGAAARLRALPPARPVVTDSVVPPADLPGPLEVVTLGPLLVEVIARLHGERSVRDLVGRA